MTIILFHYDLIIYLLWSLTQACPRTAPLHVNTSGAVPLSGWLHDEAVWSENKTLPDIIQQLKKAWSKATFIWQYDPEALHTGTIL